MAHPGADLDQGNHSRFPSGRTHMRGEFFMTIGIETPRADMHDALLPPDPRTPGLAQIAGVGTAVSATSYTQQEVLESFQVTDPKVRSVFLNSAIQRRYLTLPDPLTDGTRVPESQGDLLDKH